MIKFNEIKSLILDFDGVLTDNRVVVNEKGLESVSCYRSDGLGLSKLKSIGIELYIVSTESNKVVSKRASKLNVKCYQNIDNKSKIIKKISNKINISLKNICFVGNDINDISALKIVGFPVGVNDCFPEIHPHIIYKTKKNGGYGAVRELCDLIYNAHKNEHKSK